MGLERSPRRSPDAAARDSGSDADAHADGHARRVPLDGERGAVVGVGLGVRLSHDTTQLESLVDSREEGVVDHAENTVPHLDGIPHGHTVQAVDDVRQGAGSRRVSVGVPLALGPHTDGLEAVRELPAELVTGFVAFVEVGNGSLLETTNDGEALHQLLLDGLHPFEELGDSDEPEPVELHALAGGLRTGQRPRTAHRRSGR